MAIGEKAPDAFRTIGELSAELGVAQHILRYWETKFPQLKPLQRAGNRRYYRADDVALARRINRLLNDEGYTLKGVEKLLRTKGSPEESMQSPPPPAPVPQPAPVTTGHDSVSVDRLIALRELLADALRD
jgi:DNA-binding transcriptional MerR regulator